MYIIFEKKAFFLINTLFFRFGESFYSFNLFPVALCSLQQEDAGKMFSVGNVLRSYRKTSSNFHISTSPTPSSGNSS